MDEERYNAIDRYLAHEMDATERRAFEEQLRQDTALAEKLDIYKQASQSLAAKQYSEAGEKTFRSTIAAAAAEAENESTTTASAHVRWYVWAAAACITLAAVAFVYTIIDKPEYTEYAHFQPLQLTERGENTTLQQHAQEAFNKKNYDQAVVYLNALLQTDADNIDLKLHKGIALLELNRVEEAEAIFTPISTSPSVYQNQARWLLALTVLKQKDYDRCETILKRIPEDAEEYADAQRLLSDL